MKSWIIDRRADEELDALQEYCLVFKWAFGVRRYILSCASSGFLSPVLNVINQCISIHTLLVTSVYRVDGYNSTHQSYMGLID